MTSSKDSANRRRSIAVPNPNKPTVLPRSKRRPHSIVAGDRLSPFAKARRSLAPRRSILKAPKLILDGDLPSSQQSEGQASSQTSIQILDVEDVTQSMDITQDFTTRINDNTSRKSFGRRVSFAPHSQVRLFKTQNADNTNSTGTPPSSPAQDPSDAHDQMNSVHDENVYPGAPRGRRRTSRYSVATEGDDMDLTTIMSGNATMNEDFDEFDDDLEITGIIPQELMRKRSLSMGLARPPLSQLHSGNDLPASQELSMVSDQSMSYSEGNSSQSDIDPEYSQAMEFTVPMGQSLRPPAQHDEAWLALRHITHSGDTSIEPEQPSCDQDDMNLDDAMQRLMRARESLPSTQSTQESIVNYPVINAEIRDDSFSSTDDGFDDREHTVNMSKVLGRISLGDEARMSFGYQDSTMEESEIYGSVLKPVESTPSGQPAQVITPVPALPENAETPRPTFSVFRPPSPVAATSQEGSQIPSIPTAQVPFNSTPRIPALSSIPKSLVPPPASPSKPKAKPTFSAAFAPPTTRPSPKKNIQPSSPSKRPHPPDITSASQPSPAKRLAVGDTQPRPTETTSNAKPEARPSSTNRTGLSTNSNQRASSTLRRPSGYFAKRKSLGVGLATLPPGVEQTSTIHAAKTSPKKAGIGTGRASMGSAPDGVLFHLRQAQTRQPIMQGKVVNPSAEALQAIHTTTPAPTETSLTPATLSLATPPPAQSSALADLQIPNKSPFPSTARDAVVDLAPMLDSGEFGDNQADQATNTNTTNTTERWRDNVRVSEVANDEPPISIEQFFTITGIKFMDELSAPRRSIHHASRQARPMEDVPLAEYTIATGIDLPQLSLYTRVSKDLQAWMHESKKDFAQAEDEATKMTPELFTEYSRADEDGQAELLHQLNLIKANTRGLAKSDWYDWKLQWVEGLRVTADKAFSELESDARTLQEIKSSADNIIPALEREYATIMHELEQEQTEVSEVEQCDQDYLNELKASIAEQKLCFWLLICFAILTSYLVSIEVEALQAEVTERNAQLGWLQERMEEIETQKRDAKSAIEDAQRVLHIQKHNTHAEVRRLKDELEALEDLHKFHISQVSSELFEYVYASQFCVTIPCKNFIPVPTQVDIKQVGNAQAATKDEFPHLSNFLLEMAKRQIVEGGPQSLRDIVQRLSYYWSSCAQLRSQLRLLTIKYPVEIETSASSTPSVKVTAKVIFPSPKAKAFISFLFSFETFRYWPTSIHTLGCEVKVAYGAVDRDVILKAVTDRLSQASISENYACLLDACIEAQEEYRA
ncbi:Spc7 kinetochore protein-domain-containing protein [Infundibulicybe gibba]|nr:Spc7 kinetochore protein-domain-containing protein [Infundibulicybe gibba]